VIAAPMISIWRTKMENLTAASQMHLIGKNPNSKIKDAL